MGEAPAPTRAAIESAGGALEVTGLYLSAIYRGFEFERIGYFVRYEYTDPALQETPPEIVDWSRLQRVLSDPPSVTRFAIGWDVPIPQEATIATHPDEGEAATAPAQVVLVPLEPVACDEKVLLQDSRERSRSPQLGLRP